MRVVLAIVLLLHGAHGHAQRVVSVGGGLTEIIYALGREDVLVGVDTTSGYPPAARALPQVGYQRALAAEGLLSLRPDLLLATEEAGPPEVIALLRNTGVKVSLVPADHSLPGLYERVRRVAALLGEEDRAEALIRRLEDQAEALAQAQAHASRSPPRALFLLLVPGRAPTVAGRQTAADAVIRLAGGVNVVSEFDGYRPLSQEAIVALAPDVIVTTDQAVESLGGREALLALPGVGLTPAARSGRIVTMDAMTLLGFGPRILDAAEALSKAFRGSADDH